MADVEVLQGIGEPSISSYTAEETVTEQSEVDVMKRSGESGGKYVYAFV